MEQNLSGPAYRQLYWVTGVTGGLRLYKEADDINIAKTGYIKVPFGISVFPKDLYGTSKGGCSSSPI